MLQSFVYSACLDNLLGMRATDNSDPSVEEIRIIFALIFLRVIGQFEHRKLNES